jgi:hypothetical protein
MPWRCREDDTPARGHEPRKRHQEVVRDIEKLEDPGNLKVLREARFGGACL